MRVVHPVPPDLLYVSCTEIKNKKKKFVISFSNNESSQRELVFQMHNLSEALRASKNLLLFI